MGTFIKWMIPLLTVVFFVGFLSYRGVVQNIATSRTADVQVLKESVSVGNIRGEFDERKKNQMFDKDELVSNFIAQVALEQNKHGFDVEVDYVFLDAVGHITEDENKIRGIQFHVAYFKDGERKATSEKRLALHELK